MSNGTRLRRHFDLVFAAVLAIGLEIELVLTGRMEDAPATAVFALVASLPLALRRRLPLASFLVVWCGLFGLTRLSPGFDEFSVVFAVVVFVGLYSLGAHASGREFWAAAIVIVLGIVLFVIIDGDPLRVGGIMFAIVFVGGPWAAGLAIKLRRDRERTLTARTAELEQDQGEQAQRAVADERARIARELHDVVSHTISVTVLQARGGRKMLGTDEALVREAFDAIEHANTQALGDMRRLLALLRETDDELLLAPQPSLARLDSLADQLRSAGLPVALEVSGEPGQVQPGLDLTAYRIIQEALTNALKHAAHATARVEVRYGADDLEITVSDDGAAAGDQGPRGHGLIGIRERVAVAGGEVSIGTGPSGGFLVRARLPYTAES